MRIIVDDIVSDLLREIERIKADNRTPREIVLTAEEFQELKEGLRARNGWSPLLDGQESLKFQDIPIRVLP